MLRQKLFMSAKVSLDPAQRPLERKGATQRRLRIGWFLARADLSLASTRYRCFHFARVFQAQGAENFYFTEADGLCTSLKELDAVIVVKRLDHSVVRVVGAAKAQQHTAIFLDLCDDILDVRYGRDGGETNRLVFGGVVPFLDGIVVPSAGMAERIQGYCQKIAQFDTSIHVIPDIAESEAQFQKTAAFLNESGVPGISPPVFRDEIPLRSRRSVLWFGNFGAPYSNFGMASLLPAMSALRAVCKDIPFELVVVSSNKEGYEALIAPSGIPTRYVAWSPSSTYAELRNADVALLTSGDDEFSAVKSSNRILEALAMGVPVVASANSAFSEFSDCVMMGDYERGLRRYLGPDRQRHVASALKTAQPIVDRYRPEALGKVWLGLIARRLEEKGKVARSSAPNGQLLVVLDSKSETSSLRGLFSFCKKEKIKFQVITTASACQARPDLRETFIEAGVSPIVFTDTSKIYAALLHGVGCVVLENNSGEAATRLKGWATKRGIPVTSVPDFSRKAKVLTRLLKKPGDKEPARNAWRHEGPNPQTTDRNATPTWLFILPRNNTDWDLEYICRAIGSYQSESWKIAYDAQELPAARNYFFLDWHPALKHFRRNPRLFKERRTFIWQSNERPEEAIPVKPVADMFNAATRVFFVSTAYRNVWLSRGLAPEKARVVLGAADPNLFRGHERGGGLIGLCSSFSERTNPDCLLDLVKLVPHREFHLIGRNWEQYALFEALKLLPNFKYMPFDEEKYPSEYDKFDVFLSVSKSEGGPIHLLQAMMSNAVPVVSRTGFASDLIRHSENGFLFDVGAPAKTIAPLVEQAFSLRTDVRETVLGYSSEIFSRQVADQGPSANLLARIFKRAFF